MGARSRHWWPRSIAGRALLVLVAGVVLWQAIAGILFWREHRSALEELWSSQFADRIGEAVRQVAAVPAAERTNLARRMSDHVFRVSLTETSPLPEGSEKDWRTLMVRHTLAARIDPSYLSDMRIAMRGSLWESGNGLETGGAGWMPMIRHMEHMHGSRLSPVVGISLHLADGGWLNFGIRFGSPQGRWGPGFLIPLLGLGAVVIFTVVWATRRATRPLDLFAAAAERLGRDVNTPPMAEGGPPEVRRAAKAFNRMQKRLADFIKDRTLMLAAVSHDLRTPITRLKLRAEFMEDEEQRTKMLADLDEMEAMISATLAFSRDDAANEPSRRLDMAALLQSLCNDQVDGGFDARYTGPDRLSFEGRPTALKRAFANLIGNAVKYGGGVEVVIAVEGRVLNVDVRDSGPGIAEEFLDRAFEPFFRLEPSRNRETGGSGLGLAVVRSIIRAHGGDVSLSNRKEGGLQARVSLPLPEDM